MSKVIGGVFSLEEIAGGSMVEPRFFSRDCLLLANARGAFRLLVAELQPRQVWLPTFLCPTMVDAVAPCKPRLYPVNAELRATELDWLDEVLAGDLVVVVDYFGFVLHEDLAQAARRVGAVVVEDASHALLSEDAGKIGDYVLWSPRKFAGLPDGGVLQAVTGPLPEARLSQANPEWWALAHDACLRRRVFEQGGQRDWLSVHQQAERGHPANPVAMSELSKTLACGLDWPAIANRRMENYRVLAQRLVAFDLMPLAGKGTVPIGFTLRLSNRDHVRAALFAQDIYPSLLWPTRGWIPDQYSASHNLSASIMTLHCDQRYDHTDMDRMADCILEQAQQ